MPTNYIAVADVDGFLEPKVWPGLYTEVGGSYDANAATRFVRACEFASTLAEAALENAGYEAGSSTDNTMVTMVALAIWMTMSFGRKGMPMPEAFGQILAGLPEGVRIGEVPIPGLTPDAATAVGGVEFTDSSASGKPSVMGNLRKLF